MRTITKRSGVKEEFRKDKIKASITAAGISDEVARKVAGGIIYREGITSSDVRHQVIGGINSYERRAARQYASHPIKVLTP